MQPLYNILIIKKGVGFIFLDSVLYDLIQIFYEKKPVVNSKLMHKTFIMHKTLIIYQEWRYGWIKLQKAIMSLNKYERCTFRSQNTAQMSLCECVSEGNRLSSETYRWHFHFILPIKCLIKQRIWARCCFVYSCYHHLVAESEFAFPVCVFLIFRSML